MTEKSYGGSTGRGTGDFSMKVKMPEVKGVQEKKKQIKVGETASSDMDKEKILQSGQITAQVKKYAKEFIKKDMPILEIVEKIEDKIFELGGKPAFPTNISINEVAAHYTPSYNDETLAHGLMKVDFGTHVDGWCSDNAFTLDLEGTEENKKLIEAAEEALANAIKTAKVGAKTSELGKAIQDTIREKGFESITNLSGHEIGQYNLHAGLTIPNVDNKSSEVLGYGTYAIEPFSTNGNGRIKDGKPSGIYMLTDVKKLRSPLAREILGYIIEKYENLPFCSRWVVKEFGTKALFILKQLEDIGNLHHFAQLIETGNGNVAQAENTILIDEEGVTVTTEL